MRVMILGADGYIGFALAQYLLSEGYEVIGVDDLSQRRLEADIGEGSAVPVDSYEHRGNDLSTAYPEHLVAWRRQDVTTPYAVASMLKLYAPDAVVDLAQQPSAPYSMMDEEKCIRTHRNNCEGVLRCLWSIKELAPKTHLITIGSMGEYGTPKARIVEPPVVLGVPVYKDGEIVDYEAAEFAHYPRKPSSFYHSSKVAATHDIERACAWWGLRATDIMQGVVYGLEHPGCISQNRFSVGESQGTALNRFCAQAIVGHPLTVYGLGSQTRGFLPLRDSLQCLRLLIDNPPDGYRCVNQFDEPYPVVQLAAMVAEAASEMGLDPEIAHLDNPRIEDEAHYYAPERRRLQELGYQPYGSIEAEIRSVLRLLAPHKDRIERLRACLAPSTTWR